jgi:hypothetical protein
MERYRYIIPVREIIKKKVDLLIGDGEKKGVRRLVAATGEKGSAQTGLRAAEGPSRRSKGGSSPYV